MYLIFLKLNTFKYMVLGILLDESLEMCKASINICDTESTFAVLI
jgi:hypothetical protein